MRPVVNPALRRLWRSADSLQLGLDPDRALVLEGVSTRHTRFLALLDGTRDGLAVLGAAREQGVPGGEARGLLDELTASGVLVDASADNRALGELSLGDRDRLGPDIAAWSLVDAPTHPSARLARRQDSTFGVHTEDDGRLPELVAGLLRDAGLSSVEVTTGGQREEGPWTQPTGPAQAGPTTSRRRRSPRRDQAAAPALVVLCASGPSVRTLLSGRLLREGVPHLAVTCYESVGTVGPLVLPGLGPCLGCLDLHRADRDPGWPVVAAQLAVPGPRRGLGPGAAACDLGLATAVAGLASLAALAVVDRPGEAHPLVGAQWQLRLPFGRPRRRAWDVHPACGCTWSGGAATADAG